MAGSCRPSIKKRNDPKQRTQRCLANRGLCRRCKVHKAIKSLVSHNLHAHVIEAELISTALAELSTRQTAELDDATGLADIHHTGQTTP